MSKRNSPAKFNRQKSAAVQAIHQQISGPIPSASEMEKYSRINKDLPSRVMAMAEKEANNRHQVESKTLEANVNIAQQQFKERKIGQNFGLILGVLGLLCAGFLGYTGHDTVASIIGGSTVIGLVSVFITGHWLSQKKSQ